VNGPWPAVLGPFPGPGSRFHASTSPAAHPVVSSTGMERWPARTGANGASRRHPGRSFTDPSCDLCRQGLNRWRGQAQVKSFLPDSRLVSGRSGGGSRALGWTSTGECFVARCSAMRRNSRPPLIKTGFTVSAKLAWFTQVIDDGPHGRGQLPPGHDAGRGGAQADDDSPGRRPRSEGGILVIAVWPRIRPRLPCMAPNGEWDSG
jgi:hypothetical protein